MPLNKRRIAIVPGEIGAGFGLSATPRSVPQRRPRCEAGVMRATASLSLRLSAQASVRLLLAPCSRHQNTVADIQALVFLMYPSPKSLCLHPSSRRHLRRGRLRGCGYQPRSRTACRSGYRYQYFGYPGPPKRRSGTSLGRFYSPLVHPKPGRPYFPGCSCKRYPVQQAPPANNGRCRCWRHPTPHHDRGSTRRSLRTLKRSARHG